MARMYAKVRGSALNERIRKDGKFRSNASIGVDVDIDAIVKIVYRDVMKRLKNPPTNTSEKMDEVDTESQNEKGTKNRKHWHTSIVGGGMIASQLTSSWINASNAMMSSDQAELAQQSWTSLKGTGTLLLSTFGGAIGMVSAVMLNRIDGLIGNHIKNQIQLTYDNARLDYNLTSYDYGRNSTYTYNYQENKWIARDVQRIQNNILNQNTAS